MSLYILYDAIVLCAAIIKIAKLPKFPMFENANIGNIADPQMLGIWRKWYVGMFVLFQPETRNVYQMFLPYRFFASIMW
jgi:hypothetical protein